MGDSLLGSTTLAPVDVSGAEIVGGDFTVEVLSVGLIEAAATGDIWGVDYRLLNGSDRVGETPFPLIRFRPWLASQPDKPAYDQTYRVEIRQL